MSERQFFQGGLQQAASTRVEHGRSSLSEDVQCPPRIYPGQNPLREQRETLKFKDVRKSSGCKVHLLQEIEQGELLYECVRMSVDCFMNV